MHTKWLITFIVLINFSLVLVIHCEQCNTVDCGTTTSPVPGETSIQKGMDNFYKIMNSFLETVIKDTLYSSDSEFNIKKIRQLLNSTDSIEEKLKSSWQAALHAYSSYYACIFIGVIMPFFCCCYKCCLCTCCCRCCCSRKKDDRDPKNAKCKRITISLILTACTTMMLLGTIIACLSAQLLHRATANTDNAGFVGRFDASVEKLQTFTRNAVKDLPSEANETVMLSLDAVEKDIKGFADRIADTVERTINVTSLLDQVEVLGNASKAALDDLKKADEFLTAVKLQENIISSELENIMNEIAAYNISGLKLKANFSRLDNLTNQKNEVINAQNISQAVAEARKQFANKVSLTHVTTNLKGSLDQVRSIRTQVQAKLENISTIADPMIDSLDSVLRGTNSSMGLINEIGNYIWYGTTSLSCVLMLSVLLYYIGILVGLCGKREKRPGNDSQSCNKETGACVIVCGSCWAMTFYWLLMLIVILLFSIVGPVYAMGCRYLNGGVEGVKTFDSLFTELFPLRWGASLQNISSALENCKENKGLYTTINLIYKTINLEELINMTEINKQVSELANKDINISDTNFLTPQLEWQLNNFTVLNSIKFTEFYNQTDLDNFIGTDLGRLAHSLNDDAEQMQKAGNTSTAHLLRNQSSRLVLLMDNQIANFTEVKNSLGSVIKSLQEKSNLTTQTQELISGMKQAQENLSLNRTLIMKQALNETANTLLGNISKIFSDILKKLKNDIGGCRPAYDAVQGMSDSVCITVLNPLNGFWFGLSCTLFFFIPSTIFGDILGWLLRKKEPYKKNESDDSPDQNAYSRDFQDKITERHGPIPYSGHVQDNIPLRDLPQASTGNFQDKMPERQYPQGAISNVYHNPGFEHDINRLSSPAGRPQQDGYMDYREMTSNYAVVHPKHASRQASYYDREQPGKPNRASYYDREQPGQPNHASYNDREQPGQPNHASYYDREQPGQPNHASFYDRKQPGQPNHASFYDKEQPGQPNHASYNDREQPGQPNHASFYDREQPSQPNHAREQPGQPNHASFYDREQPGKLDPN